MSVNMNKTIIEFSIIIPSFNRCDTLKKVLTALEDQSFPTARFEVIVIDDLSTDDTADYVADFAKQTKLCVHVVQGTATTTGAARNRGLEKAVGRRILFLDSDTIPPRDVLVQHMIWHDHFGDRSCICGSVSMSDELYTSEQSRINETKTKYDVRQISEMQWQDYRTANTSIARELCVTVNGFDPDLPAAEDTEFASRLHKIGVRFLFISDINVVHFHPMRCDCYFEKGDLYGRAVARWYTKAPELRPLLTSRYGVYAPELAFNRKLKHRVRDLFVNSVTIPVLSWSGRLCRFIWFQLSDQLYKCVFRYHVRRSFRTCLKNN